MAKPSSENLLAQIERALEEREPNENWRGVLAAAYSQLDEMMKAKREFREMYGRQSSAPLPR